MLVLISLYIGMLFLWYISHAVSFDVKKFSYIKNILNPLKSEIAKLRSICVSILTPALAFLAAFYKAGFDLDF